MDNMMSQYNKFMKELEERLKNPEDIEFVKNETYKLFISFYNEVDDLKNVYEQQLDIILGRQEQFENRLGKMEKDIYMEEGSDFEIICPYCNNEFVVELDELKDEVECPECNNLIELDWNDDENECGEHGCSGCQSDCNAKKENDDDM